MFNPFDGSDRPLSYGQALVLCAERVSWPDEILARKVVDAIRAEHGLTLPAPDEPSKATVRPQPISPRIGSIESFDRAHRRRSRASASSSVRSAAD